MSPGRILVVEDDRIVAEDIAATLGRAGHVVEGIVATAEASLARAASRALDLALVDIGLAGATDGVSAAEQLRELGVGVLFLTGRADAVTVERARQSRPLGYVVKPFDVRELLAAVAIAVDRARERAPDERRLARDRLRVREEEARRIAQDLHDEAGQLLVAAHLALDDMARDLRPDARPRLQQVRGLLDEAQEELRRICHDMKPAVLDELGLIAALQRLAQAVASRSGLQVKVTGTTGDRAGPIVEAGLYRIVQEAVNNAVKHAGARTLRVHLSPGRRSIRCSVRDDGCGFDPEARAAAGLGLAGMEERAVALGGSLRVQSQAGHGTELLVSVPVDHEEKEPLRPVS